MYKYIRNIGLPALVLTMMGLTSCGDDYQKFKEYPYLTDLESVKILNGGIGGNTVFEGRIDRENKMIDFSRMDQETDFSKLQVEAVLSEGAELQESVLDFSMAADEAFKTLTLRVKNHERYTDWFIRVRKRIPVYGADFEKGTTYDYTVGGGNIYPSFGSGLVRWASCDGINVVIPSRNAAYGAQALKVEDLRKGIVNPITLDLTGVTGGTFVYNCSAAVNGHIYLISLSGSHASPFRIYYYETPESPVECVLDVPNMDNFAPDAGARNGDNASFNLDENGDGYAFFGDNAGAKVLRIKVTGYKNFSEPEVFTHGISNLQSWMTIYKVPNSDMYMMGGTYSPVMLVDESVAMQYSMNTSYMPAQSIGVRVVEFNSERYLIMVNIARSTAVVPTLYVFNITKGGDAIKGALEFFDQGANHAPDFSFTLGGSNYSAPGADTGYRIIKDSQGKDETLILFAGRADSGFVLCEFPIKKEVDD
ncbi:MAG: DUF4623 domain-containing protein [Prevotellaceae bacterium]|jgi:hypothetical protein|nr:DUF4623 domain-containing protein [Prevotellaceae bacterium]